MDLCNIAHIKALLARHGFRFSKSMGQNFLTSAWVPEEIAEAAGLSEETCVLEIGPGIGCLTEQLSARAAKVVSVELDKALLPILKETLHECENVTVVHADILELDMDQLIAEHFMNLRPVVCANLPYNITTPVLTKLIDTGHFAQITVMIQREVAKRFCAKAGSKDYGAISLYMEYHTEAALLFDVPPDSFIPAPQVHSSVITLKKREKPPVDVCAKALFRVVKAAFAQRRKTLVNCLMSTFGKLEKDEVYIIIEELGLPEKVRGEVLTLAQFAALTKALQARDIL